MSIAQRLHENLELDTPFKALNQYTPPEVVKSDADSLSALQETPFAQIIDSFTHNGLKINSSLINYLFVVVSTTGNGDLPENADRFYRKLKRMVRRNNYKPLRNLAFGILALGDSNYSDFCEAGKKVRSVFLDLGAREIVAMGLADDATGMEEVVEKWLENVEHLVLSGCTDHNSSSSSPDKNLSPRSSLELNVSEKTVTGWDLSVLRLKPSTEKPSKLDLHHFGSFLHETFQSTRFLKIEHVPLKMAKYLTAKGASKTTLHMEMDISKAKQFHSYQPGDAVGVLPPNTNENVDKLFILLNISLSEAKEVVYDIECTDEKKDHLFPRHIACPNSLYDMIKYYVDITARVSVNQLKTLSQYCSDEQEKRLMTSWISPTNLNQFRIHIQNPHTNIVEILDRFPSCKPSIQTLLQILPPQQPRYYSISSSPLVYANEIHFAYNILEYNCPKPYEQTKRGLCTSFLADFAQTWMKTNESIASHGEEILIPMFMKSTPEFRLPADSTTPIIMIGPGTGITPFRSFVQHRIHKNNTDESANWLLYGCQNKALDFLYGEELMQYEEDHKLTLLVASSRVSAHGLWNSGFFVQDLIYEYSTDLVEIMEEQGGYLYMCGDAGKIATNIMNALKYVIHEELNISIKEADEKLLEYKKAGRFQIDAWG